MKLKAIVTGCALAFAGMSAQAAVVDLTGYTKIILSGATAPDAFLADLTSSMMDGVVVYKDRALDANGVEIDGTNYRAYIGTAKAGIPGVAVGTKIAFFKRSKGGSVWGVDPVARAQRIETLNMDSCDLGTKRCDTKGIDPGVLNHEDPLLNNGEVSDFGVSDVEPRMFREPNNTENGQPELTDAERAVFQNFAVNALMFGQVATNSVPLTTVLSRTTYGSMLQGLIRNWSQVDGTDEGVVVCRRVNGSGTQTSYNAFYGSFPCATAVNGAVSPAGVGDSTPEVFTGNGDGSKNDPFEIDPSQLDANGKPAYVVVENSGSGDVRKCLNAAQNKKSFTVKGSNDVYFKVRFDLLTNPARAIGVLSLDSYGKEANATEGGWTFRNMDGAGSFTPSTQTSSVGATGIAPSKQNLLDGKWDFAYELSMQYRSVDVTNDLGDAVPSMNDPVNATKKAFIADFINRAGSTAYTGNDGGVFTSVPNAYATLPTIGDYTTKPAYVTKFSRGGNSCSPIRRF